MIIGVGFLLFSIIGGVPKLLIVQELKNKPEIFKREGMLSFPLETFKQRDGIFINTIIRLIREEIGITSSQVENIQVVSNDFRLIPGRKDIVTKYGYGTFLGEANANFMPGDDDIKFAGWFSCEELLAYPLIRVETAPILEHFLVNHAGEIFG